jgi:hypothetical protein
MTRYARYAAAIVFALLAVGFVALWVRSYHWHDAVAGTIGSNSAITLTVWRHSSAGWWVNSRSRSTSRWAISSSLSRSSTSIFSFALSAAPDLP